MSLARLQGTGAEKVRRMGRTGMQAPPFFSRGQENSARKGCAGLELEDLVLLRRHAALGGNALAPDEPELRRGREGLFRPEGHDVSLVLPVAQGLEDLLPLLSRNHRHAHALADAAHGEPDVFQERLLRGFRVQGRGQRSVSRRWSCPPRRGWSGGWTGRPWRRRSPSSAATGVPASVFVPAFRVKRQATPPGRSRSKS